MDTASQNGHKRAAIYARVSGDDTGKDGRNLASQIEMGRKYAAERGYAIAAEMPEDDRGASGASFDLPQLGAILAMAERHEFDVLVVREIDRLSRNLAKQLIVEERLKHCGVSIEYVLGEYPDNPEGNLMKHVRASVAEYEREKIKERVTRGRRNMASSGLVVSHGRPLYGYVLSEDRKHLVITEPEARIVRLIFQWYIDADETGQRLSMQAIADKLSEMRAPTWADTHQGVKKVRGNGRWSQTTIQTILGNAAYAGQWAYGKNGTEPIPVSIPAIIDVPIFAAAQTQRGENKSESKRNTHHDYLMRCRLTCACGYSVVGHAPTAKGNTYHYYRCSSIVASLARTGCKTTAYFSVHDLDALVWNWLQEWFQDPHDLRRNLEAYQAERERANAPVLALLRTNDDLIAENAGQLARVKDMYQLGVIRQDELIERKMRLETTITKLETERAKIQARMAHEPTPDQIDELVEFARRLSAGLDEADQSFEARRRIIELLDVRGIIAREGDDKVLYASFILSAGEQGKRLMLPRRGKGLSLENKNNLSQGLV